MPFRDPLVQAFCVYQEVKVKMGEMREQYYYY